MTDKFPPPVTDISAFVSDYFWRFDLARTLAEHVRRADGFVVNRRRMTPEEIKREMRKSVERHGAKESEMAGEAEVRAQELVGTKVGPGALTLRRLDGQHPQSGAFYGIFDCDCGETGVRAMISDVKRGAKKYCNAFRCPIAKGDKAKLAGDGQANETHASKEAAASSSAKPRGRPTKKKKRIAKPERKRSTSPVASQVEPPRATTTSPLDQQYRAKLVVLAATLREWAVKARRDGWGAEYVAWMRGEAEGIDELVY